jgi:hypothetical protein
LLFSLSAALDELLSEALLSLPAQPAKDAISRTAAVRIANAFTKIDFFIEIFLSIALFNMFKL